MNRHFCFCVFFLFAIIQSSKAQNKPFDPIPGGATTATLGQFLEGPYQVAQGYCINQNPGPVKLKISHGLGHSQELSAVPPQLFDPSLHLEQTVLITGDESVGRAFSYVYADQTVLVQNPSVDDFLVADYLQDPASMAAAGFDGAFYDYNCTASFAASLKSNSGWSFPIAKIAAGLSADASGQTQFHFGFVSAKLRSPIWSFYHSTVTQDQKTYAAFLMWEWYLRHPAAVSDGKSRFLLADFDGVALFKVATRTLSTNGKVDAAVAFSSPAVSINAALQAAYQSSSRADVTSYGLAVREVNSKEQDHFESLPSAAAIAQQLHDTASAHLDPASTDLRLQANDMDHVQVITGVPRVVCERPWQTELPQGTNLTGSLRVKSTSYLDASTSSNVTFPTCRFTVTYSPGNPLPDRVDLNYFLTTELVDSSNHALATSKIVADKVSLSASGLPAIGNTSSRGQVDTNFPTTSITGSITFFTYQWTLPYSIKEDTASNNQKIANVGLQTDSAQITCGSRKITPLSASVAYAPGPNATGTMTLVLTHSSDDQHEKLDTSQLEFCSLGAGLVFTLNSGASVPRKLPSTQILYPRAAPAPSPSAPPPTAPVRPVVVQPQ
jgi:hypothetical protein